MFSLPFCVLLDYSGEEWTGDYLGGVMRQSVPMPTLYNTEGKPDSQYTCD